MIPKKNFEVTKPESISTETPDLICNEKLFLSWKRYLKKWASSKNEDWNVVSLDGGKYNIPQDEYKDFLITYNEYLDKGIKLCIAERQKNNGPLVIDLDYEYSTKPNDLMNITMDIALKGKELISEEYIIMTKSKEKETKKGKKFGVHIIYPLSVLNVDEKIVIYNELRNVLKKHENKFIEKAKKILDDSVIIKNGWLLYGSMKKDDLEYYKISCHSFESLPKDLVSFLSVRNKGEILTIEPENIVFDKEEIEVNEKEEGKVNEEIKELLKTLKLERCENYDDWFVVAQICKNEDVNYQIFENWSMQSVKFDREKNKSIWNNLKDKDEYNGKPLTIATLYKMSKEDNKNVEEESEIEILLNMSHRTLADLFIKLYGSDFLRIDGIFYYFNGLYWEKDSGEKNKSIKINRFITDDFHSYLLNIYDRNKNSPKISREAEKKIINNISSLRNNKTANDIYMQICLSDKFDRTIKFDMKQHLLAFNNKIYDFDKCTFREGRRDDYISLTVGYDWIEPTKEQLKFIEETFNNILIVPEEKKLFGEILYSALTGFAPQYFILATGSGANGKTLILEKMMKNVLGDNFYYKGNNSTIQSNVLKSGSDVATALMHKKRLTIFSEPDEHQKLNTAFIKDIAGGDSINARLNHENDTNKVMHSTIILSCNDKPKLSKTDGGVTRRIINFPFRSKFVSEEEKKKDPTFKDDENIFIKNPKYEILSFWEPFRCAIFKYILSYKIDKMEFKIPESIDKASKEYIYSSDDMLNWFNENYEITNDTKNFESLVDMYNIFKTSDYYKNLDKNEKKDINRSSFIKQFSSHNIFKKYYRERIQILGTDKRNILLKVKIKVDDSN
jgi:phage/plasmid-associated DNA primase